jgi:hypothetical protein
MFSKLPQAVLEAVACDVALHRQSHSEYPFGDLSICCQSECMASIGLMSRVTLECDRFATIHVTEISLAL